MSGDLPPVVYGREPAPPPRSNWTPWLLGCGGLALVMLLICGGTIYYVVSQARQIAADTIRSGIVSGVQASELSPEDKQKIVAQVDRVVDDFKAGKIGFEELGHIMEELAESPLIGAGVVFLAEEKYVKPSGLSDEEKAAARRTLQRVARGIQEDRLQMDDLEQSLELISQVGPDGQRQLKEQLSDAELREFLASLKQKADEAEIPDEEFQIDIGQAVKDAIDRGLSKQGLTRPTVRESPAPSGLE